VRALEAYQNQIREALRNANAYLRDVAVHEFTREEMHELHEVILAASERAKELNRIMGIHLMHEVESAVERLHEFHEKMRNVERSVDGIFLVDSEVMFIPPNELIRCVNTVFSAVGNSYLSRNIDGSNPGADHVRMALVATAQECVEAAERIKQFVHNL